MKQFLFVLFVIINAESLSAQFNKSDLISDNNYKNDFLIIPDNQPIILQISFDLNDHSISTPEHPKPSLWTELGYLLAMEFFFTGMSYLASRKKYYGPAIAGSFDLFMGVAGVGNAVEQNIISYSIGYAILSAGFFSKSLYNYKLGRSHKTKVRFWTNFIGFNLLVFSGYFLDSLN